MCCAPSKLEFGHISIILEIWKRTQVIAGLSALAQASRLDIFRLLVQAGADGRPVGHIGERLGLPSATLSFHLTQLKQAGLITCRRDGRSLIYTANFDAMTALLAYLTENCCGGDAGACGIDPAALKPSSASRLRQRAGA